MQKTIDRLNVQRLLIYRLGSLGDTLVALPAFHLIRERFPNAEVTLLTHAPTGTKAPALASILQNMNLHQKTICYPLRLRSIRQILALRAEIAAGNFQLVIHLAESRGTFKSLRDYLFFHACGIDQILGLDWRQNQSVATAGDCGEWEPRRLTRRLSQLGELNLEDDKWWDLRLTREESRQAEEFLAPVRGTFLAASLGTKVEVNHWTEPNWRSLLRQIHKRWPELSLVLIGAPDEFESCERAAKDWLGTKLNLCGKVPPRVSAVILSRASLFVGHDSGPLHLAATVGTSCVGIYSARHRPGQWFPRGTKNTILYHQTPCWGCGLQVCSEHAKKCILSISVEEVLAAVSTQLADERRKFGRSSADAPKDVGAMLPA